MPRITDYHEVEIETEVSVEDFCQACNPKEIQALIGVLQEEGLILPQQNLENYTAVEQDWKTVTDRLFTGLYYLTLEEETYIRSLLKKIP